MISAAYAARVLRMMVFLFSTGVLIGGCEANIEKSGFPMKVQSADHTLLPDGPNLLANTRWRLVEFQSMDDVVGILRPDDPSRYVMRLNGDGQDEVFVYLLGSFFCGTGGCNLLLFSDTEDGYLLINEFSTTRIPIFVSDQSTDGWKNIAWLKSGGGVPSSYLNHTFNGKRYIEGKNMPADKVPMGQSYLAGELLFDKAIPLEPRN